MKFRWYDALIISVILVLVVILALTIYLRPDLKGSRKIMEVRRDNVLIYQLDLTTVVDEVKITVRGKISRVEIVADQDGCYVSYSGCPDQTCVNHGKIIDSQDPPIICLPNKIEIRLTYE